MTETESPKQDSANVFMKNSELYNLLVEENRHLHQVWIDNFRIILTFNSILLAGVFAIITILSRDQSLNSIEFASGWSLRVLSIIGAVVTLVGVHIIRRTKTIVNLRIKEIRYLETNVSFGLPVLPFEEGAFLLGKSSRESFWNNVPKPSYLNEPLKFNPLSGFGGYMLISISFIAAYIFIFLLSFSIIVPN